VRLKVQKTLLASLTIVPLILFLISGDRAVAQRTQTDGGARTAVALTILTPQLANGAVGQPYICPLAATGGGQPYWWTVALGQLPPGLALNAWSGVISGVPTRPGTYSFTVQLWDTSLYQAQSALASLSLTIVAPTITLQNAILPDSKLIEPYSVELPAFGGVAPFSWSIGEGRLPPGLHLNSATGEIAGIPTEPGSYTFTFLVTDSSSLPLAALGSATLNVIVVHLTISTLVLPQAVLGREFNAQLEAYGGQTPYTWTVIAGSLPAGLHLDPASGMISGTPAQMETTTFTIQVMDSSTPQSIAKLILAPPPSHAAK
jgi:Putative Ig domain